MKKSKRDSNLQWIEKPLIVERLTTTDSGELVFRAPGVELMGGSDLYITMGAAELREVRATRDRFEIILNPEVSAT